MKGYYMYSFFCRILLLRKYRKMNKVLTALTTLITLSSSFPIKAIIKQIVKIASTLKEV